MLAGLPKDSGSCKLSIFCEDQLCVFDQLIYQSFCMFYAFYEAYTGPTPHNHLTHLLVRNCLIKLLPSMLLLTVLHACNFNLHFDNALQCVRIFQV